MKLRRSCTEAAPNLHNDVVELAHAEMMRIVLDPEALPDGVPEPEVDFEGCLRALVDRVEATVYSLPSAERPAYFQERARTLLGLAIAKQMPAVATERLSAWLRRLSGGGSPGAG